MAIEEQYQYTTYVLAQVATCTYVVGATLYTSNSREKILRRVCVGDPPLP